MNTLGKELEDLEARRTKGTISDEDAALAKKALLQRHGGAPFSEQPVRNNAQPRGLSGWILAGVLSNLMLSLVVIGGLAAIAYLLLPTALALPLLICLVFILPILWLFEWLGDLF